MKISIFGSAGTGKSSTAKLLAKKLRYDLKSSGNLMREIAESKGFDSLESLNTFRLKLLHEKGDDSIDRELDEYIKKYGEENDRFIFESWMAWNFIPDSVKIKLYCSDEIRAMRVAERENISVKEAAENNTRRQKENAEIYKTMYNLDEYPPSNKNFSIIVDTGKMGLNEVVEYIYNALVDKNLI